jgi:lipid-binding SYLF domain-containing protein
MLNIQIKMKYAAVAAVAALLLPALLALSAPKAGADTAREIDVSVEVALQRFYNDVDGAREFAGNAKALLVMPRVIKAGLVVGGQYGEGALLVNGRTVAYYNLVAGSYGLQVGAEKMDIIIAFMTDEALRGFEASQGWEAGVDGNIALIDTGLGRRVDTTTLRDPVVGFVFGVKGLMADLSLKGAKFTRVNK